MKAVLGAAVAALVLGLGVGWLGHTVVYAEDGPEERAVMLLRGGAGPPFEGTDVYVRHFRPGADRVIGEYHHVPPPGRPYPVIFVEAQLACHVRMQRPIVHQANGIVVFSAFVAQVARPVVAGFRLRWQAEGPDFVFAGGEGQTVQFDDDGYTIRPSWCD
jgi:hypothetical protein